MTSGSLVWHIGHLVSSAWAFSYSPSPSFISDMVFQRSPGEASLRGMACGKREYIHREPTTVRTKTEGLSEMIPSTPHPMKRTMSSALLTVHTITFLPHS